MASCIVSPHKSASSFGEYATNLTSSFLAHFQTIRLCRLSPKVRLDRSYSVLDPPRSLDCVRSRSTICIRLPTQCPALNSWFIGTTLHDLEFHGDRIGALPSQGQNCQTENGSQADQQRRALFLSNKLVASAHWHSSCTSSRCSRTK